MVWTHRHVFLALAILQPLWLVVGRGYLGSFGWLTFMLVFMGAPILLGPLISTVMQFFTKSVRETRHFTNNQVALHWTMHGVLFITGIFLVDFGDTDNSSVSVASVYLGKDFVGFSMFIGYTLGIIGLMLMLAAFVSAWSTLASDHKNKALPGDSSEKSYR